MIKILVSDGSGSVKKKIITKWGTGLLLLIWTTYILWAEIETRAAEVGLVGYILMLALYALIVIAIYLIFCRTVSEKHIIVPTISSLLYSLIIMYRCAPFSNGYSIEVGIFAVLAPLISGFISYIYLKTQKNIETSLIRSIGISVFQGLIVLFVIFLARFIIMFFI